MPHSPQLFPPLDAHRLLPKTALRNVSQTVSHPCQTVEPPEPSASTQPVPPPFCTNKSDRPWRAPAPPIARQQPFVSPPALVAPIPHLPTKSPRTLPTPNFSNYLSSQFLPPFRLNLITNQKKREG